MNKSCGCESKAKPMTLDILVNFVRESGTNKTCRRKRLATVKSVLRAEGWLENQLDKWLKENKL